LDTVDVKDSGAWRVWLQNNWNSSPGIWLVFLKGMPGGGGLGYGDAVDEALCFGWIDSSIRKIDSRRYARRFTPRRPSSTWSALNIERIERLEKEGRMTEHGLALFNHRSKRISQAEEYKINAPPFPPDFMKALRKNRKAWKNFQNLSPGYKRRYLMWLSSARGEETRKRRVRESIELIERNVKSLLK